MFYKDDGFLCASNISFTEMLKLNQNVTWCWISRVGMSLRFLYFAHALILPLSLNYQCNEQNYDFCKYDLRILFLVFSSVRHLEDTTTGLCYKKHRLNFVMDWIVTPLQFICWVPNPSASECNHILRYVI